MPTGTNDWTLGTMYHRGTFNGIANYFTQPGGPDTTVYPTQKNSQPWPEFPVPGLIINEFAPWFTPGCGHSIHSFGVIREFDYNTNSSCALIVCPICSYIQNLYEPFEEYLDPIAHAIVIG